MKGPTLGVVMIVKNEEQALPGILGDIKDIADEIVIVDTGSVDKTIAIAESFGAKIADFPWINDFAAARNRSIECASCDYLLWLDADDRIDGKDQQALASLKARLNPAKDRAYMLKILGCSKDMPETVSYQTRIIPNKEGVRFEGRVHEQLLPTLERLGIPVKASDITIRHTGYHDSESRKAKSTRNLQILLEEYHGGKDTASQCFFIAMAYISVEEHEQCLEYLNKAREKRANEDWYHYSFIIATECLLKLDRVRDAYEESKKGLGMFKDSVLMHYYHGVSCMKAGLFEEAASIFHEATKLTLQVDSYPVPPNISGQIWFHYGRALEKSGRPKDAVTSYSRALDSGYDKTSVNHALGLALLQTGHIEEATERMEQARNTMEQVDIPLWTSLAKVYSYAKRFTDAMQLYEQVLEKDQSNLDALAGIMETGIDLDDTGRFFSALETYVNIMGLPIPAEINTLTECALICLDISRRLQETQQNSLSGRLAGIALRLDPACHAAHILLADLAWAHNDVPAAVASLEKALKSGADPKDVLPRVERMEHSKPAS